MKILSEEHKRKISESLRGKPKSKEHCARLRGPKHSAEARLKMSRANKGKVISPEQRKKISEALKGSIPWNKGIPMSEETRRKCSEALKGRPRTRARSSPSEETRRKISATLQRHPIRYWLGKKRPTISGSLHPQWKGGVTNDLRYSQARRAKKKGATGTHTAYEWLVLKAAYDFTCPSCWRREPLVKLTEDHIVPLVKGGSDSIDNIQPLCQSCNSKKYTTPHRYETITAGDRAAATWGGMAI